MELKTAFRLVVGAAEVAFTIISAANLSSTGLDSRPRVRNITQLLAEDANRPAISISSTSFRS